MPNSPQEIVNTIASINNKYRDASTSSRSKLEALWEIGDKLVSAGVVKPHTIGWAVQKETKELIKRSTIIRGYKVRLVWSTKEKLFKDIGSIKSLSNLFEIFPFIDPSQAVRKQLSDEQVNEIYRKACNESPKEFKIFIKDLKQKYSHGQLGRPLDRSKHLKDFESIVSKFRVLVNFLKKIINDIEISDRNKFRLETPDKELKAFSNMCISLTTKDNFRLYKNIGSVVSESKNQEFSRLYDYFIKLLSKVGDEERARLRRLISPEVFAQVSDMVSSLMTEEGVKDFKARQKITIKL